MARKIVFVDVDETLVRSAGSKRIPIPSVIAHIRKLKKEGAEMHLWSSGGADYCRATAVEFGIEECFVGFLPKPTIYIDDQPMSEWRDCRHLYPLQADDA